MTLPNFLIIGAQKCGTTALYMALRQHPQIFMSAHKEPRFFAFATRAPAFRGPGHALFNQGVIQHWEAYSALFAQAQGANAIGEASPIYLSSYQPEVTANCIYAMRPDVRLIALLRQPAERAWSAFLHHRRLGLEPLVDFRQALAQEAHRTAQHWYPGWRYRQNGLYAANLAPYLDRFPQQQIRIYLYEEWNQQPAALLADIFRFLQVEPTFRPTLHQRHNVSFVPRSQWLQRQLQHQWVHSLPLVRLLTRLNQTQPRMPSALRQEITDHFRPSIAALAQLINRDLTSWLVTAPMHSPSPVRYR